VLSGNRNFEGRVSPDVQANYLASPPLVVAYALAGTVQKDLTSEPIGEDKDGNPVYLKDIWPSSQEIQEFIMKYVTRALQGQVCRRVQGRRELAGGGSPGKPDLCLGRQFDLCAEPALFRRHGQDRCRHQRHQGRPRARPVR
jgi:hypothetical protein